jgi:serine/threonine protein kinase/Tol biopolymer transport system component
MRPDFWPRVTELVHGALDVPEGERRAWIETQAKGDAELAAEVVRLIEAHAAAGGFLDNPFLEQQGGAAALHEALGGGPLLTAGERIGPFEVRHRLGAGGMGEVWQARDASLGRDVALKVLPDAYSRDPERLRRFEQEARAAGQINHPNILTVHAVGTDGGRPYLVTELLEGVTLKQRLDAGALPERKAVDLAIQMARGLSAAHDRGIVHRDLKPANLFVTTDGRLKILDFGLAKLTEMAGSAADQVSSASGLILGTPGYMAPEQVRRQPVDHRADLFAFGAVVYEMLAGRRAFSADSSIETMHRILTAEPQALEGIDPALVRIVGHCLEKDPGERYQSARDLAFHLEAVRSSSDEREPAGAGRAVPGRNVTVRRWLPWAVAAAMLAVAMAALLRPASDRGLEPDGVPVRRFTLPPTATPLHISEWPTVAVSPNGARVAYVVRDAGGVRLHVRDLEANTERAIPGTENAFAPFFSPDGGHLGFFTSDALMRVALAGGPPTRITPTAPVSRGAVWTNDGRIYLARNQSTIIVRVAADGGDVYQVTHLDAAAGDQGHLWPDVAPDGSFLVYVARRGSSGDAFSIVAHSLRTSAERTIVDDGTFPRVASAGRVLFTRGDTLHVLDIDPVTLAPRGPPRPVLRGVQSDPLFAVSHYSVARDGTLAFAPGDARPPGRTLLWVTPTGAEEPAYPDEGTFLCPAISPDGRSVAVTTDGSNQDLWRFDVGRPVLARLTSHPTEDFGAVWSPDGRRLAFTSIRDGAPGVFVKPADRIDGDVRVAASAFPDGWTPAGSGVAVTTQQYDDDRRPTFALGVVPADGGQASGIEPSRYDRYASTFSSDGRHLAFVSLETGQPEVFVARPDGSEARQASVGGGTSPVWARDGRQLYYRRRDDVMAVAVGAGAPAPLSSPRRLFSGRFIEPARPDWPRNYDVAPDGRFLMVRETYVPTVRELVVVLGWRGQTLIPSSP